MKTATPPPVPADLLAEVAALHPGCPLDGGRPCACQLAALRGWDAARFRAWAAGQGRDGLQELLARHRICLDARRAGLATYRAAAERRLAELRQGIEAAQAARDYGRAATLTLEYADLASELAAHPAR